MTKKFFEFPRKRVIEFDLIIPGDADAGDEFGADRCFDVVICVETFFKITDDAFGHSAREFKAHPCAASFPNRSPLDRGKDLAYA